MQTCPCLVALLFCLKLIVNHQIFERKFQQFLKRTHCLQRSYQTDKPQQVIKWADVCNTLVSQGIITREDGGKEGGSSFSTDFHERLEALSELDEEQLEAVEDYLEQSARNVISQMDVCFCGVFQQFCCTCQILFFGGLGT
eukprot:TRINITY_DN9350_c0_g1_i12.p2 TRINITY_DN9350_c0_g1~~TRINITY_DN9350_c0_g1_i12.p2  ORF type:complete len:141 (+),score=13.17 TRINITY_DN9350_c0_g1_i12:18-440(+)